MKRIIILTVGLFLLSNIPAIGQDWDLGIELSKETFISHEMIWLDVTLTNVSADSIRTNGVAIPHHFGFEIDIKDSDGKILEHTGAMWSFGSGPGNFLIASGANQYDCFDLASLYAPSKSASNYKVLGMRFPFIPTGQYTIQSHFEDATSNVISFTIVEPNSVEEEALRLIEEASELRAHEEFDLAGRKFREVVDNYPNSVYAEKCYYMSHIYSNEAKVARETGSFDQIGLRRKLLENYPNSGNSCTWLRVITHEMDNSEKQRVVSGFLEKSPNTRLSKFAEQMLRRMPNKVVK